MFWVESPDGPKGGPIALSDLSKTREPMAVRMWRRWRPASHAMKTAFLKSGHLPTLISCFLYFDLSFAVWVLLGPLAVLIAPDLHLDAGQKGLIVAVPVLAGAAVGFFKGLFGGPWGARPARLVVQPVGVVGPL